MLPVTATLSIDEKDISLTQIRAQGAGGQNVNKVASAVQLRFDIGASALPESVKERLLRLQDSRISMDGVIVIKAQNHRTFERNREEALHRLAAMVRRATEVRKPRKKTRPGKAARQRRVDRKSRRGELKKLRKKIA